MSSKPKQRRGRPSVAKPKRKVRQNISLSPETLRMGQKMSFDDGLALSTWIDQMIRNKAAERATERETEEVEP